LSTYSSKTLREGKYRSERGRITSAIHVERGLTFHERWRDRPYKIQWNQ
jgi:hypothetical protein